jgi:hypothetical protein
MPELPLELGDGCAAVRNWLTKRSAWKCRDAPTLTRSGNPIYISAFIIDRRSSCWAQR